MDSLLLLALICFLAGGIWGAILRSWSLLLLGAGGVLLILSGHPLLH